MILICFALKEEAAPFQKLVANKPDISILLTGIGRENAKKTAGQLLRPNAFQMVLTCGFAGGLNPDLKIGDVIFEMPVEIKDSRGLSPSRQTGFRRGKTRKNLLCRPHCHHGRRKEKTA